MKKRFGISISEDKYRVIDELSRKTNTARSLIVEKALEAYITAIKHKAEKHDCCGLIIVKYKKVSEEEITRRINKELVNAETHIHEGEVCVRIAYVKGSSDEIEKTITNLSSLVASVTFVPLD
jgi:metal-responsive CopG/Arc/MetJ family transcriptional regulator